MIAPRSFLVLGLGVVLAATAPLASAQLGRRFPSERKVVPDPVTGVPLTFLTSTAGNDAKIYPTHPQWTSDGQWLVFRSQRVPGEALAVHEATGDLVQVTSGGYSGMLCLAQKSMRLVLMRPADGASAGTPPAPGAPRPPRAMQVVEVALDRLLADSASGKLQAGSTYERVCGTIPAEYGATGDMGLDANDDALYFRLGRDAAAKHLPAGTKLEASYGPRNMGAGPSGIARFDLKSGEVRIVTTVPFQVGHVQANPEVPGEIMFCWETGGKAPTRAWVVQADGTGLRPVYPEAPYDWVTHEVFVTRDEVAFAILGHRKPGVNDAWGVAGTREHATGLAIVNLRTRELHIAGQTPSGSGLWHVDGSPDGRWAVGDDFARNLYLIDRRTGEMMLLSTGHKPTAADHPHPTFSADSRRIQIQSAMLAEDGKAMNLCVIPVPDAWLRRTYGPSAPAAR